MKKKRSSLIKSLAAPKSAKNSSENLSGWGFVKEIQEKKADEKKTAAAVDCNHFGSLKTLTSYQVIQIVTAVTAAASGDDDGGNCNCANCYNCANCSDGGN